MNRIARRVSAGLLGVLLLCNATLTLADARNAERYSRVAPSVKGASAKNAPICW